MPTSPLPESAAAQAAPPIVAAIAPARTLRGRRALDTAGNDLARLGTRLLVVGGARGLATVRERLEAAVAERCTLAWANVRPDCSEAVLARLHEAAEAHQADAIVGAGGGKALDAAKLLAHQRRIPVATIPTSGATCAAWTALSNVYSDAGAFRYDVALDRCPDLLVLDYDLLRAAPPRLLVAGIGDAIAKWYEASVSSGHSDRTAIVAAVQQARVLRDLLLQKSVRAIAEPGGPAWCDAVDATVLLAGVVGGLGGAECRTVAAHAVHNGLTHLPACHDTLHGEKVAYGILVQLRLEETIQGSQLAAAARQQLLGFYDSIGLPKTLDDLGLGEATLADLRRAAEIACAPQSDLHHLPFPVVPEQLLAAMVSTTAPAWGRAEADGSAALPGDRSPHRSIAEEVRP